jgi:hypothetical protein
MHSHPRVVVIAGSIESIDALARFIRQMPTTFPIPVVAHLHGLQSRSIERLISKKWRFASHPNIVYARESDHLQAGHVYVISAEDGLVFVGVDVLGVTPDGAGSNADRLFASAAHWYQSEVIGVVLSGLGTDGAQGLRAITEAEGTRVVQSPNEAAFFSMPVSALRSNAAQYSVMLDQLGKLIRDLVAEPGPAETLSAEMIHEIALQTRASEEDRTKSLDRSIEDILQVIRDDLGMDIVFVTKQVGDKVVITHSTPETNEMQMHGMSYPKHQSLCQRVIDGRLPAVMPDVEALRLTHNLPVLPLFIGTYMATPVWLADGTLFGMLCCLNAAASRELDQRHYVRLQMSAR